MVPAILCPIGTIQYLPVRTVTSRSKKHSRNCSFSEISRPSLLLPHKILSLRSFSINFSPEVKRRGGYDLERRLILHRLSASVGNEVALQEPNVETKQANGEGGVSDDPSEGGKSLEIGALSEGESVAAASSQTAGQSKRTGTIRKNENPRVPNEELVPGAVFTGKVRAIQPFGAFINFGASTDGLVHISRLSDSFVKQVSDVVSIGQEVTVRILEANIETGRISLTMKANDDRNQPRGEQASDPSSGISSGKVVRTGKVAGRFSQKKTDETQKRSKFQKGQTLEGKVKNIIRSGAFISLPDGEEGFLRSSEVSEGYGNLDGNMGLQIGQDVTVRVLRIEKGRVNLTMKKEEDMAGLNMQLNQGEVEVASNPFELAFRKNPVIAAFLKEQDTLKKSDKSAESPVEVEEQNYDKQVQAPVGTIDSREEVVSNEKIGYGIAEKDTTEILENTEDKGSGTPGTKDGITNGNSEKIDESARSGTEQVVKGAINDIQVDKEKVLDSTAAEMEDVLANDSVCVKETENVEISETNDVLTNSSAEPVDGSLTLVTKQKVDSESSREEEKAVSDSNDATSESNSSGETFSVPVNVSLELAAKTEQVEAKPQTKTEAPTSAGTISAFLVKQLREETGAGMMDCKKALAETGGELEKAREFLRKKGLASAEKKASRIAAEGRIGSYIHDSRIGVLIEVNCETDFVSRGDIFKELVEDLAMQIAASPRVQYLSVEDVPEDVVSKEREIELQKEDLLNKPENIRAKIVDGRIGKILGELALLEQPFIKNDKLIVKDWVKQSIATLGENIQVRRFFRYNLGEGLEKKSQDFAAEVAAQTAAKSSSSVPTEKSGAGSESPTTAGGIKSAGEKQTVVVSAALVKQLREETGAGMMDCKKALTETGGDLLKAQEFLRKKGLASADKKSGRIAAEGRVGSYIHDNRIGVLIEVNCETDFVSRGDSFKQLVEDLAMQVVACPQVRHVSIEDIPKEVVDKEREIEMQREDILAKPEQIREKIVDGRIAKRLGELALLEQPFVKEDNVLVKDIVKKAIVTLGENIQVRRFVRYNLGEGLEKETKNLAAEIAHQTASKVQA